MARYGNIDDVQSSDSDVFARRYKPSDKAPISGIYQCVTCEKEAVAVKDTELPPQDHHTHPAGAGPITWRLVVFAQHHKS